jgi:hypothetical protein
MPKKKSSIAHQGDDAQQLLAAAGANAADLQIVEPLRMQLQEALTELHAVSTQEKVGRAERQQSTKRRREILTRMKDLTSRLRAGITSVYGPRNEKLVEFGIVPLRRRARPQREKGKEPQPGETSAPPSPAASDSKHP